MWFHFTVIHFLFYTNTAIIKGQKHYIGNYKAGGMAEAEAYQWEDGSPGVRYPRPNHTCTHHHANTHGEDYTRGRHTAHNKGTPPLMGTNHCHL